MSVFRIESDGFVAISNGSIELLFLSVDVTAARICNSQFRIKFYRLIAVSSSLVILLLADVAVTAVTVDLRAVRVAFDGFVAISNGSVVFSFENVGVTAVTVGGSAVVGDTVRVAFYSDDLATSLDHAIQSFALGAVFPRAGG